LTFSGALKNCSKGNTKKILYALFYVPALFRLLSCRMGNTRDGIGSPSVGGKNTGTRDE
jgi:hypothetical protein